MKRLSSCSQGAPGSVKKPAVSFLEMGGSVPDAAVHSTIFPELKNNDYDKSKS